MRLCCVYNVLAFTRRSGKILPKASSLFAVDRMIQGFLEAIKFAISTKCTHA